MMCLSEYSLHSVGCEYGTFKKKKKTPQNFYGRFEASNINIEYWLPFLKSIVHSNPSSVGIISRMTSEVCCPQTSVFPHAGCTRSCCQYRWAYTPHTGAGSPSTLPLGIQRMSLPSEWQWWYICPPCLWHLAVMWLCHRTAAPVISVGGPTQSAHHPWRAVKCSV